MDQDRDFTREPIGRFEWERILRRIQVSAPSVKLVGFTMATYADADGGRVRPGQSRLAAVIGTSISTVRRGQTELEDIGMLDMVVKGRSFGRGHLGSFASEYRLSVPSDLLEAIPMLDQDEQNYGAPVTGTSANNRPPMTPSSAELPVISEELPVTSEELPVIWAEEPVTHEHPPQHEHHNKDQNKEHQSLSVAEADAQARDPRQGEIEIDLPTEEPPLSKAALAKQIAEDFQDWYAIYPKHSGRGAAVNSYTKARKNGATLGELLAGARRYAAERQGQDPQFTKAPATWLNQECWADDPDHVGELDVEAILGKDYWTPGPPPAGLSVSEEIDWKKEQRAVRNGQRLEEAKTKASTGKLSPWDPAYHRQGKLTLSQKMQNTISGGYRLQAQMDAANGNTVPRQYQWCNPPRELEAPEQESA
ncbi:hypothetical protein Arth_1350 [Arthrobacter sp. FB24]|uniref:hypothetical protein n=1 Tax=Arthrobacter sp. (strain FB24) TaxID=290399 RepID=UPI000052791E|nr:hypothetical protein [Arthrobacter sp. FB24]ABK02744.1 hypothetical protein Arth_1350 [Arthrobacter sp. FB24]